MNWTSVITIIQISFCVSFKTATAGGRPKRVINGETLEDRETPGYTSPKYYVWIGFGRDFFSAYEWKWDRESCGGTLLTPQIVQTACHCFCDWNSPRNSGEEWHYRNDHTFEAIVGCSEWKENSPCKPLAIIKYKIHPYCRKIFGWVSHDYALFALKNPVEVGGKIATAPVYNLDDMALMWSRFISSRSVCMVMGFGRYTLPQATSRSSKVLRHGWQSISSYEECYDEYAFQSTSLEKVNITRYQEIATWSCLKPFGKEVGSGNEDRIGKGDSGSPITCDNRYFGLVSQGGETFFAEHTNTNDLVFYAYANTVYYRLIMIHEMLGGGSSDQQDVTVPPDRLFYPETAPRNFYAVTSGQRSTNKVNGIFTYVLFSAGVYY